MEPDPIEAARAAVRDLNFAKAEGILKGALSDASEPTSREELLRLLFFVYFNPRYEQFANAERCLEEIDEINPSAENAIEFTQFLFYCRQDYARALTWSEEAVNRSRREQSLGKLYTSLSLQGAISVHLNDRSRVEAVLDRIEAMIREEDALPLGDSIAFLENAQEMGESVRCKVARCARRIADLIDDPEYRDRATRLVPPE